jgi:hypothetical protein
LVDVGAVLRCPYDATAFCECCLHSLQAHQKPTVLPQQMHQKPPLSGQEGEYDYAAQESQQLGSRKRSEPGERAWPGPVVTLQEDEACDGSEGSIAR